MKKKLASLCLVLALCLGLAIPAMAAERTVYLDGYTSIQNSDTATVVGCLESSEGGELSISGDFEQTGTVTYADFGEIAGQSFVVPLYHSSKAVTVTVESGIEEGGTTLVEGGGIRLATVAAGVDAAEYDEAANLFTVTQRNIAYFKGNVGVETDDGTVKRVGSIQDVMTDKVELNDIPFIFQGATVTLSDPGIYHVYAYLEALEGSCEAYIWIGDDDSAAADTADTTSTETPAETPTDTTTTVNPFTDVAETSPYRDAILWAVEENITKGTTDTTFAPSNTCTNNHILTFLWRANGSPAATVENPFENIDVTGDFGKAALWAYEQGLVEDNHVAGLPGGATFPGSSACTRGQTVTYLWKLAGSPETAVSDKFTDVAADADYAQAVAWAVAQGITQGTGDGTTFSPDATCTRGQIVTFLYRAQQAAAQTDATPEA